MHYKPGAHEFVHGIRCSEGEIQRLNCMKSFPSTGKYLVSLSFTNTLVMTSILLRTPHSTKEERSRSVTPHQYCHIVPVRDGLIVKVFHRRRYLERITDSCPEAEATHVGIEALPEGTAIQVLHHDETVETAINHSLE